VKLTSPVALPLALGLLLACAACAPGDGMRFQVMNMERPSDDNSMPPPADYQPCYTGEARGYDTNGYGKIDTWDVMDENGNLTRRAHDSNGDGRVDQAWTFDPARHGCAIVASDVDGDGKPDPGSPVDICRALAAPAAPPAGTAK